MNHGKVRIYDLSKELEIENKEVLEICSQLNIVVKSHSSTITESQAERIRATAQRQGVLTKSPDHNMHSPEGDHQDPESVNGKNKQEILAVHHKQSQEISSPESKSVNNDHTEAKVSLTPPPRPPKPPVQSTSDESEVANSNLAKPQESEISDNTVATVPDKMPEKPQLLQPPSRPEKPKPQVKGQKKSKQNKRGEISGKNKRESQKAKEPEKVEVSELVKPPVKAKAKSGPSSEKEQEAKALPKLIKPQLPKPARPEKPVEKLDNDLDSTEEELENEKDTEVDEVILLEKPKRNKISKPTKLDKGKQWQDEEEEEAKGKLAKTQGKNKRRPALIEDDDEDLDELLETAGSSRVMNLAIARPPKPKSDQDTPAAKSSPTTKPKKPQQKVEKRTETKAPKAVEEKPEIVSISGSMTVRELSDLLKVPETEIIKSLFFKGIAVNITQTLEIDTAKQVAEEFDILVDTPEAKAAAAKTTEMLDVEDLENLTRRPPVVTIMGHVDHGKTTLLDSIRETKVAQGEAGGITQHIGAYHVDVEHNGNKQQVVFLDTPGHEAFTAMRARGTKVTDIAVLVVAADDGVQPQTREAISHARAAEVPIVVAINKIDKLDSNPDRVKQELMELGLVPEEWGGDTIMVPVSALKGENLDTLLEMIILVSEVEELSANPDRLAKGTIVEAHLDRAKGAVATLLVQNGTLKVGDIIVAGAVMGKIRAMIDDRGQKVETASPSFAVEILGLSEVPQAGDEFEVFENEKEARAIAEKRGEEQRESRLQQNLASRRVSLSSFSEQAREGQLKELNLILKADVQGSVEAIVGSLQQLPQNEVQIRILLASPGEVTETDVDLAAASGAVIVGFNTTLASGARGAADQEGVDIREYNIIYKLLDDIQGAMEGLLDPEEVEEYLGTAEVRAIFPVGRGSVAGCYVQSGKIIRNRNLRVIRKKEVIYQGNVDSLKRMKDDVKEVNSGYECGIGTAKFHDWQEGDLIEVYQMVMKRRTLAST